jgi:hypothetical protein
MSELFADLFKKRKIGIEEGINLTNSDLIASRIPDDFHAKRAVALMKSALNAIQNSGLESRISVFGSSVWGKPNTDVDFYLEQDDLYQRDRNYPHKYRYLESYNNFKSEFGTQLANIKRSYLPDMSIVLNDFSDKSKVSNLHHFKYGYYIQFSNQCPMVIFKNDLVFLPIHKLPSIQSATKNDLIELFK